MTTDGMTELVMTDTRLVLEARSLFEKHQDKLSVQQLTDGLWKKGRLFAPITNVTVDLMFSPHVPLLKGVTVSVLLLHEEDD